MASATNRVALAFVEEVTFGVTPSTPTLEEIRYTGESLKQSTTVARSTEIRSDRQVPDVVRTQVGADGDVNFELYAGDPMEKFVGYALQAGAKVAGSTGASLTVTVVATAGTFTASTGTPFAGGAAGEWIKMSGFAAAGNNGYYRIRSIGGAGLSITVDQRDDLADVTAGIHSLV